MIFNIFKSKPTLKELIPEGFVDIHSHILPGIDDGAKDVTQSLELIKEMKKLGFSKIIGTPHTYPGLYENSIESIKGAYKKVKEKGIKDIDIDFSSEYMLDNTIIEKVRNKKILCLKDNYVLIEMSFIAKPIGLYELIYEIKVNGFLPVLAHPERYLFLENLKEYDKLKKFGCLFQANLLSLTNHYGKRVNDRLNKLISRNLIDFVGSDVHNTNHILAFEKKVELKNINKLKNIIEQNNIFR